MTAMTAVMPTSKGVRYRAAHDGRHGRHGRHAVLSRIEAFHPSPGTEHEQHRRETDMANESNANNFNARDYLNSTFIKKADLRQSGPRRLTIKAVEQGQGLPGRNGSPAKPELQLVFQDDTRLSLRAQVNLRRMLEAYGDRTATWIGKPVEVYFSPDVVNPGGGEPGGIRIRVPEHGTGPTPSSSAPSPDIFTSELDEEPSAKPRRSRS
jgi:hypothetical protein